MTEKRVAVVTGGSRGIGAAIVKRLARDGMHVVAIARNMDKLQAICEEVKAEGGTAEPVAVDIADSKALGEAIEAVSDRHGRLDVLVNNAGICEAAVPTWEMPLEAWHRTLAIDLTGVFHGCRAVLPGMIARGWGRIVNIASIAGKEGKHNPVAYVAAKAGVIGLTKAVAFETAAHGVLVNAITPGSIWTQNWAAMPAEQRVQYEMRHPVGRFGRAEEVAAMVAWLSGDECSFSTGAVFDVSGGRAGY